MSASDSIDNGIPSSTVAAGVHHARSRAGAIAAAAMLLIGAASAQAQDKDPGKGEVRIIERDDAAPGKEKRREVRIVRREGGKDVVAEREGLADFRAKCDGANKAESNVEAGGADRKYVHRIVVCGEEGESQAQVSAQLLKALRKARSEIGERDRLSAENRAEAVAALDREIARVQAEAD